MATGYARLIREVPDFPRAGILFRDITPLLQAPGAYGRAVGDLCAPYRESRIDAVVAVEARGYLLGGPVALELGAAMVPARKAGKLPAETISASYTLEYGEETIELHRDGLRSGQRALIVDDLLATGGTLEATVRLVERAGAEVAGVAVLIELAELGGRSRLEGYPLFAALRM